jgi:hypothetical protein
MGERVPGRIEQHIAAYPFHVLVVEFASPFFDLAAHFLPLAFKYTLIRT